MKIKPCEEKVTVIWPGEDFGHSNETITLPCCLMAPHPGYKHENPRLQLTIGGDRIEKDAEGRDITQTWSYYIEPVSQIERR